MTSESAADASSLVAKLDTDLANRPGGRRSHCRALCAWGYRRQPCRRRRRALAGGDPFRQQRRARAVQDAVAAAAGAEAAAVAAIRLGRSSRLGASKPRRIGAGRGRPLRRARRARSRAHSAQPHRHRDRSRARLRHRPSRHDARLSVGPRCDLQGDEAAEACTDPHPVRSTRTVLALQGGGYRTHRQRHTCAFSMSARAPACWRSPPPGRCTRPCWRPTSTLSP